jgi:hypothetical protein
MNIVQIENSVNDLIKSFDEATFIYDFLLAYDTPKSIIKRLRDGGLNLSKNDSEILWKKKIFFKAIKDADLHLEIERLKSEPTVISHLPRFIITTDYDKLLAIDTKNQDSLDIPFFELDRHYAFFLPLAGMEKAQFKIENPADVKAAEKMAKLYDEIKKDNPTTKAEEVHGLNVFLSRLLFCFFAEDTEIFSKNIFTNAIKSHTQANGSDLKEYLERLFKVLNTDYPIRSNLPEHLDVFQYVNGGLFREEYTIPQFTYKSRNAIIECGELNWKDINPDIFGSMIQAVVTPEHRGGLGMHYTSVPNIMKVIEPLFLNELYQGFEYNKNQPQKLENLLYRLSKLKIFDPACGSGNFLIIAYKELRFLEIKIIQRLEQLQQAVTGFEEKQLALIPKAQQNLAAMYQRKLFSNIQLTQFYGIELDDFAHEVAMLSLWLAQHQMNMKFKEEFGQSNPTLPLKDGGNITHGNATSVDWEIICPKKIGDEVYILGNPPYLGRSLRSKEQQEDMDRVFRSFGNYKDLDYIACWFFKGVSFIKNSSSCLAFVSTNSICQGTQVNLLWPQLLSRGVKIHFCYQPYKWTNNAKSQAGVSVVTIGLCSVDKKTTKKIYNDRNVKIVENISPYLTEGRNLIIVNRFEPIAILPEISLGNAPKDDGGLILSLDEQRVLEKIDPSILKFVKKFIGAEEFINNTFRYCLWIEDADLSEALKYEEINRRLEVCRSMRARSKKIPTQKLAKYPHRFGEIRYKPTNSIIIPSVSSERRDYIPIGFLDGSFIVSNSAFVIYDAEPWVFAVVSSNMHNIWVKSVAGRLESRIRYSSQLCYNTFPFPPIVPHQKTELEKLVYRVLDERETHSEKTLALLYDPDKMPKNLKEAHKELDLAIERCYRSKPFENDEERLEYLFKLYEQMIADDKSKGTLFELKKKSKKVNSI